MNAGIKRPDWSLYSKLLRVGIDDAVALSLGLDPNSIKRQSALNPLEFLSDRHKAEYEKRLQIAISHLGNEEFFRSQGMTSRRNPIRSRPIFLGDFVKLAAHCQWRLPAELGALAANADAAEQSAPVPDVGACETAVPELGSINADGEHEQLPPYITTSELVGCFGGYMGVANPAKVLSGYPKWTTKGGALVQRGRRGTPSKAKPDISAWNPVQFALNLLDKRPLPRVSGIGNLKQQHLDTVFGMKSLAEWKPLWIRNKPL
jgi:hypothetical protein